MASTAPFLIGTPVEVPTIRSHLDQVSGKSYAKVTQPPLKACHSAKTVLLLTTADTILAVGKDRCLLDVGTEEMVGLGTLLITSEPT